MCGFAGELAQQRAAGPRAPCCRMSERGRPARAGRRGRLGRRGRGARAPAAGDHRPLEPRRAADGRLGARSRRRLQRLHLQPRRAAGAAGGLRLPLLLDERHRGAAEGVAPLGRPLRRPARRACSRSASSTPSSGRALLGRDRLGIKPLYLADGADGLRFASTLPALLAGGGIDTSIDPVALHHYLSWHAVVPAPRTILNGVRKLAPATAAGRRARRPPARDRVLAAGVPPQRGGRAALGRGMGGGGARAAENGRRAPHGGRRAGRRPPVRRARLEPHRRAARRARAERPDHLQHRLRGRAAAAPATSSTGRTWSRSATGRTTGAFESETSGCCRRSPTPSAA